MPSAIEMNSPNKVHAIYESMRQDILDGRLKPGSALPPQRQLGRHHGVSETTASIALVKLVHEGLVTRSRGRGSFVAKQQPGAGRASRVIDFVRIRRALKPRLPDLAMIEDFAHACRQEGCTDVWHHFSVEQLQDPEPLLDRFLQADRVVAVRSIPHEFMRMLVRHGVRAVSLYPPRGFSAGPRIYPQLVFSSRDAVRMAVDHLVSIGHQRIAYVGGLATDRISGFLAAVQQHHVVTMGEWMREIDPTKEQESIEMLREMIGGSSRPEGICCATEAVAAFVEDFLLSEGLRVPQDIAIIACDDGPQAVISPVAITAVGRQADEVCQMTLKALDEFKPKPSSEDSDLIEPTVLPLKLTVRDSCGAKLAVFPTIVQKRENGFEMRCVKSQGPGDGRKEGNIMP